MNDAYLIGLDLGGGGGRALLVDTRGDRVLTAFRPWRMTTVPGTSGLGYDLDVERTFALLADACREVVERAGIAPEQVVGIAPTSMREGTVVLDAGGNTLLATPNRDARAAGEGLELAVDHGDELYRRTGRWPLPIFAAARLMWLARQHPEVYARAQVWLSLGDWVGWKLCGVAAAEPSQAGESLVFDLATRDWAPDLIERFGLRRDLFPTVRQAGERLGSLSEEAAAHFGLTPGIAVGVGGADSQCGMLGAGCTEAGQLGAVTGTTAPVQLITAAPIVDERQRLWTGHHVVPDLWVLESNAGFMGEAVDWLARMFYPDSPHPCARLLAEAAQSEIGASGLLSSLGAEVMNAREPAAPLGHLTLSHLVTGDDPAPRRHVMRAVVEGLACGLRANVEQLLAVAGEKLEDHDVVRLGGGMTRSATWTGIVADFLAVPVEVSETAETTALGAAMCASVAAGVFPDLGAAAGGMTRVGLRHEPDGTGVPASAKVYSVWERVRGERRSFDALGSALAMGWVLAINEADATRPRPSFRPRILVTADFDETSLETLRALGDVEYTGFRQSMRLLTGPSLVEALQGVDVFITEVDLVDAAALAALPGLRVVATCRGDAVNVDIDACDAFGVPVLHAPGRNAVAVADVAVAFALMLARKLPAANAFLRRPGGEAGDIGRMGHAFSTLQGHELWSRTIGLVGLGAVGREVARRLRAFGARILVADPFVTAEQAALSDAELVTLETLLETSDIVSLHAPVTEATRGMIGAAELGRMKQGACFINTARAALVDEAALVAALENGHLAGAAVDVFEIEPPASDHPLLRLDNVVATPHVAGNTAEVAIHQGRIIAGELARLLAGERPAHALNPHALDGFDWNRPRPVPDEQRLAELRSRGTPAVSDLQRDKAGSAAAARSTTATPAAAASAAPGSNGSSAAAVTGAPASGNGRAGAVPDSVREKMERIVADFVARVAADQSVRAFSNASGSEVTLHFHLSDLGLDFYVRLAGGQVEGGMGKPEPAAEVLLKMAADILDGMFTGRVNAMQSAMDGRLSFTGDAGKAMTLQDLQADFSRLYQAARETIGDPGDLSALAAAPAANGAAPAGGRGARADEIITIVNELYASELITATGGNVSARTSQGAGEIWITPSQLFKGELSADVLVRIDLDGQPLDDGARSPSSERLMHTAIYRAKPAAEAVVHCHAPHATILANADLPFLPISTEAAFFGDIPRVPFIMPGTGELAEAVGRAIGDGWAVMMKNHGLIVAGRSLRRAADMCEIIERSAEIMLGCWAVGKEPPVLPGDVITKLRRMGDLVA